MNESNETTVHGGIGDRTSGAGEGVARTLLHALVGGLAGVLLAFLPYSTVLGGAVAGYLESGDYVDGATVGTAAGIVALVPVALAGLSVAYLPVSLPVAFDVFALPVVLLAVLYVVGFSLLGGVLGTFLRATLSAPGIDG